MSFFLIPSSPTIYGLYLCHNHPPPQLCPVLLLDLHHFLIHHHMQVFSYVHVRCFSVIDVLSVHALLTLLYPFYSLTHQLSSQLLSQQFVSAVCMGNSVCTHTCVWTHALVLVLCASPTDLSCNVSSHSSSTVPIEEQKWPHNQSNT